MITFIEFKYGGIIESAPIVDEGSSYYIVDWGQPEQLVVSKDEVIRKYIVED